MLVPTRLIWLLLMLWMASPLFAAEPAAAALQMLIMDPLAAPLSCPCVQGYAQRKYERLAEYLERRTERKVQVAFADALSKTRQGDAARRFDLIIGKDSVVRADAQAAGLRVTAVARLTGKDGATTQTGWFVVRADDPAQKVADLQGYRIFFGTAECAEKYAAALQLLKDSGVKLPEKIETTSQCSEGASRIIELGPQVRAAAVISSYAHPLLEGCGTIKKGELRSIGKTKPVPFVTAFLADTLPEAERRTLTEALLEAGHEPELCLALETMLGFVPLDDEQDAPPADKPSAAKPPRTGAIPNASSAVGWTGWRGPRRDGICPSLPRTLPEKAAFVWERRLARSGLGGVAATDQYVLIGDRDPADVCDVFRCFHAADGAPVWTIEYPAPGKLDYGNSPRATPLIHEGWVYLFGAFGDLHCVRLETGEVVWMKNLRIEFGDTSKLVWGTCSSPLVAEGKLIVNPGTADASLAALDPETGETVWQTPGTPAGFGSLIVATLGGVRQIVGHDRTSLGGWDVETGARLWQIVPPNEGDFNVPTPIQVGDKLLVTTEHNGTRLYAFSEQGKVIPEPVARHDELAPDISTPVVVGERVFGVWQGLYCLDLQRGLQTKWLAADRAFRSYAALLADQERLLVIGTRGELVLVDATADRFQILSRLTIFPDAPADFYAHPALVGNRLYLRGEHALVCLAL